MSKVLLVEDDFNISTLYKIKLEHSGYTCLQAYNGLEALKLLENNVPDLILLDLKMPVMDGEQFLELYRKNYSTLTAPIIVLTNINSSEAPKTLWHHDIEDYIVKAHTTPGELVETIRAILAKQS
ncbi:response regulator [bacterium]|nr:response regulator [bacterium]NBX97708.1 response regulator [bacterium]